MKSKKKNHPDLKICYDCFILHKTKDNDNFKCPSCNSDQNLIKYNDHLNISKKIVRYGYQYREQYERDFKNDPELNSKYFLEELNNIYGFIVLAVLNGVIGNFASDKIKAFFQKLKNDPLIIEIDDERFKALLENENEQQKFIQYIQEYRESKMNTHRKVQEAINEEIQADEFSERVMQTPLLKKIMKKWEKLEKATPEKSTTKAKKNKKTTKKVAKKKK